MQPRRMLLLLGPLMAALAACGPTGPDAVSFALAPIDSLPPEVRQARPVVQQSYRLAFANREVFEQIPCYCGCQSYGHRSLHDCYVASVDEDGRSTFDPHALACNICNNITQDAFRLGQGGRTVAEIRAYLAENYSQYGPSTGFEPEVP